MGCNCKDIEGFDKALINAIKFEKATGKEAAIFKVGSTVSFTDKKNIKKVKDICCYYTTDKVEHKIPKPKKRVVKKTEE